MVISYSKDLLSQQLTLLKQRLEPDSTIEWQDVVDLRADYGETDTRETVRKGGKLLNEYLEAGWNLTPPPANDCSSCKKSIALNPDGSFTSDAQLFVDNEELLHDSEHLIKMHGYDPRCFELISAKNSRWQSPNAKETRTLYSSKISVRRKAPETSREDIRQWFEELDRNYSKPIVKPCRVSTRDANKLLILPISDLHYNLHSTLLETGNEYNCALAEKLYFSVIADVLERTKSMEFEKIIFTIGGDQANADNIQGTTTKGTPQNNEFGYFEMIRKMYTMTIQAIDLLKETAPVEVILINGNHDLSSGVSLAHVCAAWFRNDPDVNVDLSPLPRKYFLFGKSLFCFAHDADVKRLPALIPDECREVWSQIDTTEVFLQHLHGEAVLMERDNMRVQRLPTISAKSEWANNQGYNSKRQCKSFIFDKELGLTDVLYTPIKK